MAPHCHEEAWLSVILHGSYEEHIRSRRETSNAGDLLFCPAQVVHSQRFGARGAMQILLAPEASSLEFLLERGLRLQDAPRLNRSTEALGIGLRLRRELECGDAFSSLAVAGLALELFAVFGRSGDAAQSSRPPPWLRRIRSLLEENAMAFSLADLAKEAQRHPVHVAREFRRHYGRSVGDYLRCRRCETAAHLLRSTSMPLIEVAYTCGYAGPSQLSRSFKMAFGVTPSEYRRQTR